MISSPAPTMLIVFKRQRPSRLVAHDRQPEALLFRFHASLRISGVYLQTENDGSTSGDVAFIFA